MNRFTSIASLLVVAALVVGVLALTGGSAKSSAPSAHRYGPASSSTGAGRAGAIVQAETSSLGRVLTDGQGRTLYLFEADKPNVSKLSAAGLSVWPPLAASGKPHGPTARSPPSSEPSPAPTASPK